MSNKAKNIEKEFFRELTKDCKTQEDLFGEGGLIKRLVKGVTEAALAGELDNHLGYKKKEQLGNNTGNSRNGYSAKTINGEFGEVEVDIPRDRNGTYEPQFVERYKRKTKGLDDKIISLYARGMTTRDIQSQVEDLYGVELSAGLISDITNKVTDEVKMWQSRPLSEVYPILYLDALVVKVRENKQVINKSIYVALGINLEGQKEVLGLWISQNEGAKFWLNVLTEIKNRGVCDIFIACVDGLVGFPDAIEAVFPKTKTQLCIVHLIRNSVKYVSWKERKELCADLKLIYQSATAEEAELELITFGEKWDKKYPSISKMWHRHWANISTFFEYPAEIKKIIYTTNAIESLNSSLRKVTKNKKMYPSDEAVFKQLYLALDNIAKKWTQPIFNWKAAMNRFSIEFEDRMP